MRYYVEINGESSLDIQGLMIQSLPSISKPLMRSKQETIDGRDGDIVTKLGYSAYDKTLKIGLWGNYDINEVIAFFNQEGTITFSNEPDKYYRFTILNRDDYVSQLDKFRTCTIALHCQPYKYKLNEEAEELENEYVEQEGTSLSFNNSLVAPMNIDLKGNTLQTGTPTPSSPIPVNNVSGDNDIVVCGKNMLGIADKPTTTNLGLTYSITNNEITINGKTTSEGRIILEKLITPIVLDSSKTYKLSQVSSGTASPDTFSIQLRTDSSNVVVQTFRSLSANAETISNISETITYIGLYIANNTQFTNVKIKWQLEENSSATTYEAYNGTTYNIDLPVENLFNDTLEIGNISTSTGENSNGNNFVRNVSYINVKSNTTYTLSSTINTNQIVIYYYTDSAYLNFDATTYDVSTNKYTFTTSNNCKRIRIRLSSTDTTNNIQLELGSKPNTYTPYGTTPIELNKIGTYQDYFYKENDKWYKKPMVLKIASYNGETITTDYISTTGELTTGATIYYKNPNENPSGVEITYTPLINQLESIKNAMSKEGTTNVNQVNNDAPFIITASVLSGTDSITLTNEGNATSKPTITITGSGVVGVYLENIQMFNISLGTNETIIIDTENMEAYYGSQLKNRQVTGDYSNFALQSGTNNLKFTGLVTNVEITNYNRWI